MDAHQSSERTSSPSASDTHRRWTVLRPVEPEVLQRMLLYKTKSAYYLLGYNGEETQCRLLIFSRTTQHERLSVVEDSRTMNPKQASELLQEIHSKDLTNGGGLQLLCEAFGILGCFRFLEGYYLFLITKRKPLGSLAGHTVYGIADTSLIPLSSSNDGWAERRYRKLLLSGVDLTKDFFFSYTYNLSYTVQHNLSHHESFDPFDCIFVWNEYLTRDLRTALNDNKWVLPLVHGSWQQRNLSIFGKLITLTLVSRRSRRFAGTRYLKRGINQHGWVANEVETEQIISLHQKSQSGIPSLSSLVQLRGSIPLFWSQGSSSLHPRPGIMLYNMDPLYTATAKHFEDLIDRYGTPVVVLNLVKSLEKHPRETILRREFGKAIAFLNQHVFEGDIVYLPWDYKEHMRKNGHFFLKEMEPLMRSFLQCTGSCFVHPGSGGKFASTTSKENCFPLIKPQLQQGVLRSNCIDCLDRTNICQYVYGLMALGYQLCSLGLLATNDIDPNCSLAFQLMEMYEIMGNVLALQYGGSEAHGKFFERMRGHSDAATKSREVLTSIKRYYSNAISDPEKQDAINLFLGNFIPRHNKPALWELESDYFLHCGVDWEIKDTNFGSGSSSATTTTLHSRPSMPVSSSDSNLSNLLRRSSTSSSKSPSSIQIFPVPVISQTGDPELPTIHEQLSKKENPNSHWSLKFWLGMNKDTTGVHFKLPESKGPSLESFEEMLKANPVIEVRLHDGDKGAQKGGQRLALQQTFARIKKQEELTDLTSRTEHDLCSESSVLFQSRSSSLTAAHSKPGPESTKHQKLHGTNRQTSPPKSRNVFRIASEDYPSLNNPITNNSGPSGARHDDVDDAYTTAATVATMSQSKRPLKSASTPERSGIRSWFTGLSRASTGSQIFKKQNQAGGGISKTVTQRASSTPAEMEGGHLHDHELISSPLHTKQEQWNPAVEEIWDQYWSITKHTLTSELTVAERISSASNKSTSTRLVQRQICQNYHQQSLSAQQKISKSKVGGDGINVEKDAILDELLSQCLETQQMEKDQMEGISEEWEMDALDVEQTKSEGQEMLAANQCHDLREEKLKIKPKDRIEEEGLKANINELLFSSSSLRPGDRILEKWFIADQRAKADYQKYEKM